VADTLGMFEQAVLLAIVRLGDDAYGRAIMTEVRERLDREVAAGAVHATLERLEQKRLVKSTLRDGTPIRGGRARRYYRLQPAGAQALENARKAANALWRRIPRLSLRGIS
jgi:PadR family transcriptional regulator PadR